MRQGMRPGHNHPSSIYVSWSRLTNSCFDGNNEYPTSPGLNHVKYALGVCATVRPLRAEVPVHPLCWFLSKSKYALGMRWTFFRPRTRLTYAPEVCARTKTLCSVCVLPREKEVCAQVCAEPKGPMDCLGQPSFETGYAPGMRQPHSSLVILFQLEHGEDPATGFAAERQVCDDCFPQSEAVPQVCGLNLDMSRRLLY